MDGPLQVVGFGSVSVDAFLYVDAPLTAGKGRILRRHVDHGGNVATALVAVAALGGRAGFIGWLGDDPADASAAEFRRHGVDVARAPRRPDARPITATITVGPDGERFIAYDDAVPHGTDPGLPDAALADARVLLVDNYATHALDVVARARRLGLAVVADVEWAAPTGTDALLAQIDHLVSPIAFGRARTGASDPAEMLAALWTETRAAVVLTDGARGAVLRRRGDDTLWRIPAHDVRAVDTTGAGDCFHGAYALALAEGADPRDAAVFAAAAAAISVTGAGGRGALPDRAACAALAERGPRPEPIGRATAGRLRA
jgi:sugar/nucleoside kinase (ribokinase family)